MLAGGGLAHVRDAVPGVILRSIGIMAKSSSQYQRLLKPKSDARIGFTYTSRGAAGHTLPDRRGERRLPRATAAPRLRWIATCP